jgi:hypothetical protein
MPIAKLRNLGAIGVVTDVDPFDLPPGAFSLGVNVRFAEGKVSRGPVFRSAGAVTNTDTRHLISYEDVSGNGIVVLAHLDGTLTEWASAGLTSPPTETDVTEAAWAASDSEATYTSTEVNDVIYINRPDHAPWYRLKGDAGSPFTEYPDTAGQWDSDWRTQSLRSFLGALIAINVTKGGSNYPTMVKWSEFSTFGNLPLDWDETSPTSNAGENTLVDMKDQLLDGLAQNERFILYSATETWQMVPTNDSDVFAFDPLWRKNRGVINQNCVVDVEGIHYVFGSSDIWMHDGVNPQSISDGRVRKFVYEAMITAETENNFAVHYPNLNEVMFCYVSDDRKTAFPYVDGQKGCNRAAVYNYLYKTWQFYDLPYVTSAGIGAPYVGATYADAPVEYGSYGGSYSAQADDTRPALIFSAVVSDLTDSLLRTFDLVAAVSTTTSFDADGNGPCYLERRGIDLDELGDELYVRGDKLLSSIWPQGRVDADSEPLTFGVGTTYEAANDEEFPANTSQTYDGRSLYQLDFNLAGRFLALTIDYDDIYDFSLSGLDVELLPNGDR